MSEASSQTGKFVWYEYMGNDLKAAADFYTCVVGWSAKDAGMGFDFAYEILSTGSTMVAGMMDIPAEAKAMGARPGWLGYIWVEDVDKALPKLTAAGGKVFKAPADIPGIGRFAVVADPDGAVFMLFRDAGGNPPPPPPPGTPGLIGWRELHAGDGADAFAFYSGQFGWTKARDFDMGPMGVYHIFDSGHGEHGRDVHQAAANAGAILALLLQRRRHRRRGRARQGEGRHASSTDRWKFPAASGSCRGSIRRTRCSRFSRRNAELQPSRPRPGAALVVGHLEFRLPTLRGRPHEGTVSARKRSSPEGEKLRRVGRRRRAFRLTMSLAAPAVGNSTLRE